MMAILTVVSLIILGIQKKTISDDKTKKETESNNRHFLLNFKFPRAYNALITTYNEERRRRKHKREFCKVNNKSCEFTHTHP